jgi:hypothetical protein
MLVQAVAAEAAVRAGLGRERLVKHGKILDFLSESV